MSIDALSYDNCTFKLETCAKETAMSGLYLSNKIEGYTNYTNCNFSGYVNHTISNTSYAIGTLEGYTMYGTRNIINCKV